MLYPLIEFFLLHQSSATKYTLIGMPFLYQQLPISPLRSRFTIFCASLRSFKRCSPPIPVTRLDRKPRHMKKDTYICKCLFLYQQIVPPRILPDTFVLLPFKFMHAKRTHISASPFPLSAASYPPGPLPAKYFRRL